MPEHSCRICGNGIRTMTYKGTGLCSILCEKVEKKELTPEQAAILLKEGSI